MKKPLLFIAALFLPLAYCSRNNNNLEQYVLRGSTMGTSYNIKIVVPADANVDAGRLHAEIKALLKRVNNIASTYIKDSELSQFNRAAANEWVAVSPDLVNLIRVSSKVSSLSQGAFDVTVGPLVNLWGFGPEQLPGDVPAEKDVLQRKGLVGWQNIAVREKPPALLKKIDGVYCDLSAIAKGWGVDMTAEFIEEKGFKDYLVEIGGEIRAKGVNAKGAEWKIGISSPKANDEIERVIKISDIGVATSGDYRNYFEKNGVRYSHTIDPRTGAPIQHGLASVTVIHPSCMMADAFATAIDVLGPEDGLKLAKQQNLTVFMIIKTKNGFIEKMTPSFKEFIIR